MKIAEDVGENVIILEYCGEAISRDEGQRRRRQYRRKPTYLCALAGEVVLDGRAFASEARFINSSHRPNCVLETWWVGSTPHVVVRTLRALATGEEILVDYGYASASGDRERCLCGEKNCTGWIGERRKGDRAVQDPAVFNEPPPLRRSPRKRMPLEFRIQEVPSPGKGGSEYERARVQRIRENQKLLRNIGLVY